VEDDDGHKWPLAFFFAASDTIAILSQALLSLREYVEQHISEGLWEALVMIDKDDVERGAIEQIGWQYLLCEFHVSKLWCKEVNLHARNCPGTRKPKYI
jgi:hypothetical protein